MFASFYRHASKVSLFSKRMLTIIIIVILTTIIAGGTLFWVASNRIVDAYDKALAEPGDTLIAPTKSKQIYLVNNSGDVVHSWMTDHYPGLDTKLLPNGQLLRTYDTGNAKAFPMGGRGGGIQLINWDGTVAWDYQYSSDNHVLHHDAMMMPNGHVLASAWVKIPEAQALAAGVNPANIDPVSHVVWDNEIIEIDPSTSQIVWKWNAYDHLVQNYDKTKANYSNPADSPRRIDANYFNYATKPDWLHVNAVDYDAKTDQIMISVREFNELWVIDHSTSTTEAATSSGGSYGHGGDLLYRYGNPEAYGHGSSSDRTLFLQHDIHWIGNGLPGAGDVLLFNNGDANTSHNYSSVLELLLPQAADGSYTLQANNSFFPAQLTWQYAPKGSNRFFSEFMGSAQRLSNGNTLVTDAMHGHVFEVSPYTSNQTSTNWSHLTPNHIAWSYNNHYYDSTNTSNKPTLFRAYKYPLTYSGLSSLSTH